MPFGRLFRGRSPEPSPENEPDDAVTDDNAVAEEESAESDVPPEWDASGDEIERSWRTRAGDVISGSTSTGSKRADALYGEGNDAGPTHYIRAQGCRLTTPSELSLIDCTMALGSVALLASTGMARMTNAALSALAATP